MPELQEGEGKVGVLQTQGASQKKGRRKRKPHTPSIGLCIDSQGC